MVYAYPANEGSKFRFYVFPYVYPYFHQSWTLFAPVPKENFNVYVKHDNGHWEDIFYKIYSSNQNNRFGGNESLMLAFSNSLRYYASSVSDISSKEEEDDTNVNFTVLKKMIVNYCRSEKNINVKNCEVIVRIRNINGRSDYSHYYKLKN